jgi:hypothetical protein
MARTLSGQINQRNHPPERMTVNNDNNSTQIDKPADDTDTQHEIPATEGEFKVTVRKLEMPVRPRGVLAE